MNRTNLFNVAPTALLNPKLAFTAFLIVFFLPALPFGRER